MWTPKFCGEHSCHGIAVQMRAELNQQEKRDSTEIRRKILELHSLASVRQIRADRLVFSVVNLLAKDFI